MDQVTMTILMLVICFALMYFLTIRPQKKKDEELRQMMEALEVGDSVMTNIVVFQWKNQRFRQWRKQTDHLTTSKIIHE